MLPTIENSQNFKTEYSSFKSRVEAITNEQFKADMNSLLTQLVRAVRMIDEQHQNLFMTNQIPSMASDTKEKISELRQTIAKRLDEWDKAVKSQQNS